jgi:hypothetical protein
MQLIANGTQGPATIPAKQAATGTPGFANSGPPGTFAATIADPDIFNTIIAELVAVVQAAGLTPDPTNNAQLLQAMLSLPGKNVDVFTASGTFVVPANVYKVKATVIGGGGGSSGCNSGSGVYAGPCGGGGGWSIGWFAVTPGASITVTVGAGGAAAAAGAAASSGGASSFGTLNSATGGSGGGIGGVFGGGGAGAGAGGAINGNGGWGSDGNTAVSGALWPGLSGGSLFGGSVRCGTGSSLPGGAPGAGGSAPYGGTVLTGSAGAAGIVIVEW